MTKTLEYQDANYLRNKALNACQGEYEASNVQI